MLVDPVVQSFIYENGLYLRTPERKNILRREDLYFRRFRAPSPELPGEMARLLSQKKEPLGVVLRVRPQELLGWVVGHTLHGADLYDALQSLEAANYVRRHTSGRILLIDHVHPEGDICRLPLPGGRHFLTLCFGTAWVCSGEWSRGYLLCRYALPGHASAGRFTPNQKTTP